MRKSYEGLAGKKLPEVLAEFDSETIVYLGSKSSFFEIATVEELRAPGRLN